MSPFDFSKQILQGKKQLIVDEPTEKFYLPFIVNRALSYYQDCVSFSNEMNQRHHLDKKLQNDFLLNTIRSMKRPFAKWAKPEKNKDIDLLKEMYGFSTPKAREALKLLSDNDISTLRKKSDTGGIQR